MLSDEKFCERALKFALLKNTDGKFFALEDYRKAISDTQTDKDKKVVYLYATDVDAQYPFIEAAKNKGYDVLLMDCELDAHFVNLLEQKIGDTRFARVDSDSVDNLIVKEEKVKPQMADEDKKNMETMFKAILPKDNEYIIEADNLGEDAAPILITRNEFMRRYREMSALGGGMNFYGEMPESFNITANLQNPLMVKLIGDLKNNSDKVEEFAAGSDLLKQLTDLALLSNGLLKGKALSDFIARTGKTLTDYYSK